MQLRTPALIRFAGRAGDRNDRAMVGSGMLSQELSLRLAAPVDTIGASRPPLSVDWATALDAAMPQLRVMQVHVEQQLSAGRRPVIALGRCAVALATLPAVARMRPDVVVVWLDAHADLNTPVTTPTGYLGGLAFAGALGFWNSGLGAGLSTSQAVLAGARDLDPPEHRVIHESGIALVGIGERFADRLSAAIAGRPVYVHIDCDVLEPGIVPTEYAVPGGLSLQQLSETAAVLASTELVGLEIGELEHSERRPAAVRPLLDALDPLL